jgi:hypothetical protein
VLYDRLCEDDEEERPELKLPELLLLDLPDGATDCRVDPVEVERLLLIRVRDELTEFCSERVLLVEFTALWRVELVLP